MRARAATDPAKLLIVLPVAAAAYYLGALVLRFNRILNALYWNSDIAFMPLLAEDLSSLASAGFVQMGNNRYYSTLWFLLASRDLPFKDALWRWGPYALSLGGVVLLSWGCRRVAGKWAALMTALIAGSAASSVLLTLVVPGVRVSTWFTNAVMAAAVIFLAGQGEKMGLGGYAAACVAAGAGVAAVASDPLFLISGLGPFIASALVLALVKRDPKTRRVAVTAAVVTLVSLAGGAGAAHWTEGFGFRATFPSVGFRFATMDQALGNLRTLFEVVLDFGRGGFLGRKLSVASLVVAAAGVTAVAGFFLPPLMLRRLRDKEVARGLDGPRLLWTVFWALSHAGVVVALLLSNLAVGAGLAATRYAVPIFYSVAALAPVWAAGKVSRRCALAIAATVFIVLSSRSQIGFFSSIDKVPVVARAGEIRSYLQEQGLARGYGGYWTAHAFTWNTKMRIRVYPVQECRLPASAVYCPFPLAVRSAWYKPEKGPSFILVDPTAVGSLRPQPPPEFGPPRSVKRFGRLAVFAYDYDVAARFADSPAVPAG